MNSCDLESCSDTINEPQQDLLPGTNSDFKTRILNYSERINQNFEEQSKNLHEFADKLLHKENLKLTNDFIKDNQLTNTEIQDIEWIQALIEETISSLLTRLKRNSSYTFFTVKDLNKCFESVKYQISNIFQKLPGKTSLTHLSLGTYNEVPNDEPENMNAKPKRGAVRINFTKRVQKVLKDWLKNNMHNPYPSQQQKEQLAREAGITSKQVQIWFSNRRTRMKNKKPKKLSFSSQVKDTFLKQEECENQYE